MSDLTENELNYLDVIVDYIAEDLALSSSTGVWLSAAVAEIRRHRAMVARLEAWAEQLDRDTHAAGGTDVGPFIAAELRNRMKEPSHG